MWLNVCGTTMTGRTLCERFGEHRRDICNNQQEKSGVAKHFNRIFNRPKYSPADVTVVPLETIRNRRESLQQAREQQLIIKVSTITPNGMNRTTDQQHINIIIIIIVTQHTHIQQHSSI